MDNQKQPDSVTATNMNNSQTFPKSSPFSIIIMPANESTLATPVQQIVKLKNPKILPKVNFVKVGNKTLKLVPFTGDKKLIVGKLITQTGVNNKVIPAQVVSVGNQQKLMPKITNIVTMRRKSSSVNSSGADMDAKVR